jgi:type IV pilus assembly protein PilW
MKPDIFTQKGFTLLELMVAMSIMGIVMAAMVGFQQTQTRGYVTQEVVTDMQQNVRAAMHFMTSEIRMAGCDPTGNSGAQIREASDSRIRFSMDFSGGAGVPEAIKFDEDDDFEYTIGVPSGAITQSGEDITYQLNADGDLVRTDNITNIASVIAQNFDAFELAYIDGDGNRIDTNNTNLGINDRQRIRSVQITILARSGRDVPGFMNRIRDTRTYTNPWGDNDPPLYIANDDFRRILLSSEAALRNRQ